MSFIVALGALKPTAPVISGTPVATTGAQFNLVTPSTEPQTGIGSYILQQIVHGSSLFFWQNAAIIPANQFPYTLFGLAPGTTYQFQLLGVDNSAQEDVSPPSPVIMVTTNSGTNPGSFDYYISPSGNINNTGTLANPWSIAAFYQNSPVSGTGGYAGKKIGLLPGTYDISAWIQLNASGANNVPITISFNRPALVPNGGTAANPTYIASCNAQGQYQALAATITAASNSAYECGLIGQGQYTATPASPGNIVLDGLTITNNYQYGIAFYFANSSTEGIATINGQNVTVTGIEVKNCEISSINGLDNDNVGGVFLQAVNGAWVHNNKIHDVQGTAANADDVACLFDYYSRNNLYEFNTLYDCNNAWFSKFFPNGNHTFRYNYVECAALAPQNAIHGVSGGIPPSGQTDLTKVYNNVLKCPSANLWDGSLGGGTITQSFAFYNNTCQFASGQTCISYPAASSAVNFAHYNNVYIPPVSTGEGIVNVAHATLTSDYNNYGGTSSSIIVLSGGSYTFATAPAAGYDSHSANVAPSFNSTGSLDVTGYKLTAGSAGSANGSKPGSTTGTGSGAACDMGAWGGANPPTQLGYSATPPSGLFTQPTSQSGIAGNLIVPLATPHETIPTDDFVFVLWEPNPFNPSTGLLVANTNDVSALTGFKPNNFATAQLSYQNTSTSTTAQMEAGTVGMYLNSADLGYASPDNKLSLFPTYNWTPGTEIFPFASANSILSEFVNAQIPTASAAGGAQAYLLFDHRFIGPGNIGVSVGLKLFPGPGQTNTPVGFSYDSPSSTYQCNPPLGGAGLPYVTPNPGSNLSTGSTWNGFLPFSWQITQAQFVAALNGINTNIPASISTDPTQYKLSTIHVNAELGLVNTGGSSATLGASLNSWTVQNTMSAPSGKIKFNPGMGLALDPGSGGGGLNGWLATIASWKGTPNLKHILLTQPWSWFEFGSNAASTTFTQGSGGSAQGFAAVDQLLTACANAGFQLHMGVEGKDFGGLPASAGFLPAYMQTTKDSTGAAPLYVLNTSGTAWNGSLKGYVKYNDPVVTYYWGRLCAAYGARYDSNPHFEMWHAATESTNGGPGQSWSSGNFDQVAQQWGGNPGNPNNGLPASIPNWAQAMRNAFPTSGIRLSPNFVDTLVQNQTILNGCVAPACCSGAPDGKVGGGGTGVGVTIETFNGFNGGHSYVNQLPCIMECQTSGQTGSAGIVNVYNFYMVNGTKSTGGQTFPNYMIWGTNGSNGFTVGELLAFISAGGSGSPTYPVNAARPSTYN